MKPSHLLVAIAALTVSVRAVDEQTVTVKGSSIKNGMVVVGAHLQGKPTELDCQIKYPSCSQPQPGEYSIRTATADEGIYQDCTNVVLSKPSGAAKEKTGVYCWLNATDCYLGCPAEAVHVETIPAVVPDTVLESPPNSTQSLTMTRMGNGYMFGDSAAFRTYETADHIEALVWYGTFRTEQDAKRGIKQSLKRFKVTGKERIKDPNGRVIGDRIVAAPKQRTKAFMVIQRQGLNYWIIQSISLGVATQVAGLIDPPRQDKR